jgi:hypothetical protein
MVVWRLGAIQNGDGAQVKISESRHEANTSGTDLHALQRRGSVKAGAFRSCSPRRKKLFA